MIRAFQNREQQLRLQMALPPHYDYGAWIRHAGVEEACNRLALWSLHGGRVWLSSAQAAGKSHLLRTFVTDQAGIGMLDCSAQMEADGTSSGELTQQWMESIGGCSRWMVDMPAGCMPQAVAHALFHLLERARDLGLPVVIAWRGNPDELPPELSSRLLAMERIEMAAPADDEVLLQVLRAGAGRIQWDIREQVLQAMLTYLPRQLDVLVAALHALEALSFEQKHKPGPAWVKQQLMRLADSLA